MTVESELQRLWAEMCGPYDFTRQWLGSEESYVLPGSALGKSTEIIHRRSVLGDEYIVRIEREGVHRLRRVIEYT